MNEVEDKLSLNIHDSVYNIIYNEFYFYNVELCKSITVLCEIEYLDEITLIIEENI